MDHKPTSTDRRLLCSKELLARASRLLGDSAFKRSNVAQFEPHTLRDAQKQSKRDYQESEPRCKAQGPDSGDLNDDYGLYFADIYRNDRLRLSAGGDGLNKQRMSVVDRRDMADVSLSTMRGHIDDRSCDIIDDDRIIITYLLHALEIERLVLVNKEIVADAQAMNDEIDDLENANAKLTLEKEKAFDERDHYKRLYEESQVRLFRNEEKKSNSGSQTLTKDEVNVGILQQDYDRKCKELNAKMREDFFTEKRKLEVSLLQNSKAIPSFKGVSSHEEEENEFNNLEPTNHLKDSFDLRQGPMPHDNIKYSVPFYETCNTNIQVKELTSKNTVEFAKIKRSIENRPKQHTQLHSSPIDQNQRTHGSI